MLAVRPSTRIDAKRRAIVDSKKQQFAKTGVKEPDYAYRMNFYTLPPTSDISLEQFETWGIARLKVLAELEACQFRNRTAEETAEYMRPILQKHLPLSQNSSRSSSLKEERKRDHYSHWTLRLAFSATDELRKRFARLETMLFKLRLNQDDVRERKDFVSSLNMNWDTVDATKKAELGEQLKAATAWRTGEDESWFMVDWEQVPDLVEHRRVYLRFGKAYVHVREQLSMVISEFGRRLDAGLQLAARALPRMDEDDRLSPILTHLAKSFAAPDSAYSDEAASISDSMNPTAISIDALAKYFPLCMLNLHRELRKQSHLKHFGRLQYTLFLKGIGMDLNQCIEFWRRSFKLITEDKFKKEYLYNVRHAYGDVGGNSNRRGRGYAPHNCQKILTEALPGAGQSHGCPYRTFTPDNLIALLQSTGVNDREVLNGVRDDVERTRYHIACNRVFEATNKAELKRVKEQSLWPASELDTIVHPNTYFKRSFMLKNLDKSQNGNRHGEGTDETKGDNSERG